MTDWKPSADLVMLQKRAVMLAKIRAFFFARHVMEVDVPAMARATVTDPNIDSFVVSSVADPLEKYFLMTSPEFYMKRLLAAGCGSVYYLGKAFRAELAGSRHNPEFTMLEWYRPDWTLAELMEEVLVLVNEFFSGDVRYTTYRQVFEDVLHINPHRVSVTELRRLANEMLSPAFDTDDRGIWLDLLFSHVVEPRLEGLVFVNQFPSSQAALAQAFIDEEGNEVAARFELYINGVEIANGYQEETSPGVLSARFAGNLLVRNSRNQFLPPVDEKFMSAMSTGLPACSGVALGFDRLLMMVTGEKTIASVMPFAHF